MDSHSKIITPRLIILLIFSIVIIPMLPLLISLNWGWIEAWIYAAVSFFGFVISRVLASRKHPDLLIERARFGQHEDTKSWDRLMTLFLTAGGFMIPLVAGLDRRCGWSSGYSISTEVIGLVLILSGYVLGSYALITNRYFSGTVRIQKDREHQVITSGPYRWVRHPGYLGSIIYYLGIPFFLDSAWTFIPVFLTIVVLIIRTGLEDATLRDELGSYTEYTNKVCYRLFPGVW